MSLTKVSYSMIQGAAVNLIDYGIEYTSVYDESIAKSNRTKIEQALRDTTKQFFILPPSDKTLFICGAIHPIRSDLTIWQQKGCNIQMYSQNADQGGGHLWGFALYQDPDNGNFTITGTAENIVYILDGDIQTAFGPTDFAGNYNNNAIGFYDAFNCQVIGTGGISKSNHDGINFDGLANNCHVDINYVKDCSTINIQMKGSAGSFNSIRASYLYNDLFDDTTNQPTARSVVRVGGSTVLIDVDYIESTKAFPAINLQTITEHAQISLGTVKGNGSHLVRMYNTKAFTLNRAVYSNLQYVAAIAGVSGDESIFKNITIENVTCSDASVVNTDRIIDVERTPSDFDRLIVRNCDFSASSGMTDLIDNLTPGYFDLSNTKLPSSYGYTSFFAPRIKTKKLANYNDASFVVNTSDEYGVIKKVHMQLVVTSGFDPRYQASVDLTTLAESSLPDYLVNINSTVGNVTINRSGSTYTFTAPAGYRFSSVEGEYV